MSPGTPTLSVIVPLHDAPENLRRCIEGLRGSSAAHELILADDASSDPATLALVRESGARGVRLEQNRGPAAARNAGARIARGELLAFVDSDVVVHPDALARIQAALAGDPALVAVFGSYDERPAARGLVSEYRNLLHHWTHHRGAGEASTFWAGLGAIRRAAFEAAGGFDERYARPSIEDIELGMRLKAAGGRLRLEPGIQGTHLKRWRFLDMLRVDVARRAVPWTRLVAQRPDVPAALNLAAGQKLCVALVFLALLAIPLGALEPRLRASLVWLWLPLLLLAPVLWINREFYAFLHRHRGTLFALGGMGLHLLYFVYGGLGYLWARVTPGRGAFARTGVN